MLLFIPDTTLKYMENNSTILQSPLAAISRFQFIVAFFQFNLAHTGDSIGKWFMYSHTRVKCEPYFIGIHVVDATINTGKWI